MLLPSFSNIMKTGLPLDKVIALYRSLNFKSYFKNFFGINFYILRLLYLKFEYQHNYNKINLNSPKDDITSLKHLNGMLLRMFPPFKLLTDLRRLNLFKHAVIGSNKGRCLMKGLPIHGQRTWSNSKTSGKLNKNVKVFIRKYVEEKSKITIRKFKKIQEEKRKVKRGLAQEAERLAKLSRKPVTEREIFMQEYRDRHRFF